MTIGVTDTIILGIADGNIVRERALVPLFTEWIPGVFITFDLLHTAVDKQKVNLGRAFHANRNPHDIRGIRAA